MQNNRSVIGDYQFTKFLEDAPSALLGLGINRTNSHQVQLKLWQAPRSLTPEQQDRLRSELVVLQALVHPHLLPLLDVQVESHQVLLVSAYAPAGSLNELLGQEDAEALSLAENLQIIDQVGQALQALHAHDLIHGNLTPQAVFFSHPGHVRLSELLPPRYFWDAASGLTQEFPRCFYLAPEQFAGALNASTDQYALGCLAYLLLTGRVPFAGSDPDLVALKHEREAPQSLTVLNPAVPEHIEVAVLKALSKDPQQRFASVQAFLDALDISGHAWLSAQNTQAQPLLVGSSEDLEAARPLWEWDSSLSNEQTTPLPLESVSPLPFRPSSQRASQKRERSVLVAAILLVLLLVSGLTGWLYFSSTATPTVSRPVTSSVSPTSNMLTPVTETHASPTAAGTVTSLQIPTPTPSLPPALSPTSTSSASSPFVEVSLSRFLNNEGIGQLSGPANFDGSNCAYPSSEVPAGGLFSLQGIPYQFPSHAPGTNDNVIASGQKFAFSPDTYKQVSLLVSASWGPVTGSLTIHYTDGSTTSTSVTVLDWYNGPANGLNTTDRYCSNNVDHHPVYIYILALSFNASKRADSLILPSTLSGIHQNGRLHVFALTLQR